MRQSDLPTTRPDATVLQAMRAIDEGAEGVVLVTRRDGTLFGVLTDGDIRRFIVSGGSLDDPIDSVATTDPYVVQLGTPRADVLDLLRARRVYHAPVLDSQGRVVAMHSLSRFFNPKPLNTHAVIMAGGRGTRLGELTRTTPKPMIRVAGRPILEWMVLNLIGYGVTRITIAVNYLADAITEHFGDGSEFGAVITYIREHQDKPLGTAGALCELVDVEGTILVMNGDLMTRFDPGELLRVHGEGSASATIALSAHTYQVPFGVVATERDGKVCGFTEKPVHGWDVAAGIYALDPPVLDLLTRGQQTDLPALIDLAMQKGMVVSSWKLPGDWADIGRPADLSSARGEAPHD